MRLTAWLAAAVAAFVVAMPAMAGAPDANAARTFVQKLYSHYPQKEGGPFFDPTGKNANEVFEPGMVALFQEDTRLANGEVGFVDGDPICMCQDDSGLKPKIVSVTMKGANADVVVDLHFSYEAANKPNPMTIHLVPVKGQWRIYDLTTKDEASYRADLAKANKEAAAAAGHH